MAQSKIFTNKDLNKPITNSKSRVYTNSDLEDDFQPDDFQADDNDDFEPDPVEFSGPIDSRPMPNPQVVPDDAPDTWWEGFANSVISGDAFLKGSLPHLKKYPVGAIKDLPATLMHFIKSIPGVLADAGELQGGPVNNYDYATKTEEAKQNWQNIKDITLKSGNDPEGNFGRLMGQFTGQPIVTEGAIKLTPPAIRTTGRGLGSVGRVMQNYQPMSTATGAIVGGHYGGPIGAIAGMYKPFTRPLRAFERGAGSVIESIGNRLKSVGNKASVIKEGELVDDFVEGEFSEVTGTPVNKYKVIRKELPPSNTKFYGPESDPNASFHEFYRGYDETQPIIRENQSIVPPPPIPKRKITTNGDGTFTDKETGEIIDNKGNPIISINNKELTRDSEFYNKNRQPTQEPREVHDIIKNFPQTGNIKFDKLVSEMQRLRTKAGLQGLDDTEYALYENIVNQVRNHEKMPPYLEQEWKERGRLNKERGPKFKVGDEVKLTNETGVINPNKNISTLDRNSPFFKKNRQFNTISNEPDISEPLSAKTESGKGIIGVNVKHSAKELTTGYENPMEHVMVREGLQNALDAVKDLGLKGEISVSLARPKDTKLPTRITMSDNGRGMSRDEMFTVYTDLHSSGKTADTGATGGKGVGKATYMLGGGHFEVISVKEINGQKYKSSFSGTPDELMSGFDIKTEIVPNSTPTGTKFTTTLTPEQDAFYGRDAMDRIREYSRNRSGKISYRKYNEDESPDIFELKGNPNDSVVASDIPIDNQNNTADLIIPEKANLGKRNYIKVQVLNNGMWQFEKFLHLGEDINGIPNDVIVDLKPKVEELSPQYPFPVQRESVKAPVWNDIETKIKTHIVDKMASKKKQDLVKLWSQMKPSRNKFQSGRDSVFFDPGDRLLPVELKYITESPHIYELQHTIDAALVEILYKLNREAVTKRLIRTGLTMDPDRYGVHIPNPHDPKNQSAIFINPFEHMVRYEPEEAAFGIMETVLHETAHIGLTEPDRIKLKITPEDLKDPRVGKFLQSYLNETLEQGGLDLGHSTGFIRRLGEIYAKTGATSALRFVDKFHNIIRERTSKPGNYRGYSPEIQKLLQIYQESRGRAATSEDVLSGTGIKHETRPPNKGIIPSTNKADGNRTSKFKTGATRIPGINSVTSKK